MTPRQAAEWEVRRHHPPVYRAPVRIGGMAAYLLVLVILAWAGCPIIGRYLP